MKSLPKLLVFFPLFASVSLAWSEPLSISSVPIQLATEHGPGTSLGVVQISESEYGLIFTPHLDGLPAGLHGFHIHGNPSCNPTVKDGVAVPAGAAGGHWDPEHTGRHEGPYGDGHLGDLPALVVGNDGHAEEPILAPRLKSVAEIRDKALMIHLGGDNYHDHPAPLGGGGARLACGVIQ